MTLFKTAWAFLLHHWLGSGLSLALLAAVVIGVLLAPAATFKLLSSAVGFVLDKLRAGIEWARKATPLQRWRVGCMAASLLCAYLAVLTGSARHERDVAVQQLASVQTTIKTRIEQGVAECKASAVKAQAQAEAHARQLETQLAEAMTQAATNYERGKADAKRNGDAVAAGIRAGTVQLRDEWTCPSGVSGAAGGGPGADGAADLRATGTGRLFEIGDTCDAHVRGLQAILRAERAMK